MYVPGVKPKFNPYLYNEDVRKLENELAWNGYLTDADIDGFFDTITLSAVNRYKNDKGLWNYGVYSGVVGITTWESLGLKVDNDYEVGIIKNNNNLTTKGAYVISNGFNVNNGINLFNIEAGIGGIEGDYKYWSWNLNCVSADATIGVSTDFIGVDVGASLINGGMELKFSIPFTDNKLVFGGEGDLFAIGYHSYYDKEEKRYDSGDVH